MGVGKHGRKLGSAAGDADGRIGSSVSGKEKGRNGPSQDVSSCRTSRHPPAPASTCALFGLIAKGIRNDPRASIGGHAVGCRSPTCRSCRRSSPGRKQHTATAFSPSASLQKRFHLGSHWLDRLPKGRAIMATPVVCPLNWLCSWSRRRRDGRASRVRRRKSTFKISASSNRVKTARWTSPSAASTIAIDAGCPWTIGSRISRKARRAYETDGG